MHAPSDFPLRLVELFVFGSRLPKALSGQQLPLLEPLNKYKRCIMSRFFARDLINTGEFQNDQGQFSSICTRYTDLTVTSPAVHKVNKVDNKEYI